MVDDWARMARHYAARDAALIIGGTSLLLCLRFCFPDVAFYIVGSDVSGPDYLLLVGIAYVLGYFVQEALSIVSPTRVTTSTHMERPGRCLKWAYERCTHAKLEWSQLRDYDEDDATIYINRKQSERNQADYERMTAHLVMCMAIGSCWMLAGCILIVRALFVSSSNVFLFGGVMLGLGCCLVFLGRVKAIRIKKFQHDLIKGTNEVRRSLRRSQQAEAGPLADGKIDSHDTAITGGQI